MSEEIKDCFSELLNEVEKKRDNNFYLTDDKYENILKEVKEAKVAVPKQSIHYRRLKRYNIMTVGNDKKLIAPISCEKENMLHYVRCAELFSVIHNAHISTGHRGRTRMLKEVNRKFKNVTTESIVIYLRLCQPCQKKQKITKKGLVVKPILHSEMNYRAQVDLTDMQSNCDNDFKFIFVYQDHVTKFVLCASCTKTAEEVAYHLLDIFSTFGAPCILHSDNGREFCNKVIQNLCVMWPDMKIVHGKPRHSQSQGSMERANQDIENMLSTWMETNKTPKWSEGLRFLQAMKNRAYHEGIKCSPYVAMFGVPMQMGVATSKIPSDGIRNLSAEGDLEKCLLVCKRNLVIRHH
ncbi:KRAB-A domain-containing protein 2-like [Ranitomeya imitator]|uniref:KRAB-A domain-containing protein 2-like n=1 Tax=Ranitomeya imitator TaxID=111125 RepID=UPI0037E94D74